MTKDVVFVWIPKNAGTSVWNMLEPYGRMKIGHRWQHDEPLINKLNKDPHGIITTGHLDFPEIYEKGVIRKDYLDRAYKFAIVRNPWDRVVSLSKYLGQHNINKFCRELQTKDPESLEITSNVHGYSQANPQVNWLYDKEGNLLVDKIIRFENLDEELKELFEELGLPFTKVPHLNSRPHEHYSKILNHESKEIIKELYKEDIERFGYTYEEEE